MDINKVLLLYVCPTAGCVLAFFMFMAPVKALQSALQKGSLGKLNPLPFAVAVGNCFGWVCYGFLLKDAFILAANIPGLFLNLWLNNGATKIQYHRRQREGVQIDTSRQLGPPSLVESPDKKTSIGCFTYKKEGTDLLLSMVPQEHAFFFMCLAWATILFYTNYFVDSDYASSIIGVTVNCNLVFFYAAPLSLVLRVIKARNSAMIHRGTMYMNTCNSIFWVTYGLALNPSNYFIVFPNVCGCVLGLVQILMCFCFPRQSLDIDDDDEFELEQPIANYGLMEERSQISSRQAMKDDSGSP